mgnify:FL=1
MCIDIYVNIMEYFFSRLFLLFTFIGIIAIWRRMRKKPLKYGWVIPLIMVYSIFALYNIFIASIAYDDISDPNYSRYKSWELHDFILNDLKMLIVWLIIGVIFYFKFSRKQCLIRNHSDNPLNSYAVKILIIWLLISIIFYFVF